MRTLVFVLVAVVALAVPGLAAACNPQQVVVQQVQAVPVVQQFVQPFAVQQFVVQPVQAVTAFQVAVPVQQVVVQRQVIQRVRVQRVFVPRVQVVRQRIVIR